MKEASVAALLLKTQRHQDELAAAERTSARALAALRIELAEMQSSKAESTN